MKKQRKMFGILQSALLVGLLLGFGTQATAYENVQDNNYLEIDENVASTTAPGSLPDDWDRVRDETSGAFATTHDEDPAHGGIIHDGVGVSIFTGGGTKDINDLSDWAWKSGSVPDKDEILHAAAAAYNANNELLVYLMADRYATDGSAEMGVWFFQNRVSVNPDGTFSGIHRNGDLLMLAAFTQGGAQANLDFYVWDDTVKFNLKKIVGTVDYGYAISNGTETSSVTPDYTPKGGIVGMYPVNAFFEGGVNMTQVFKELLGAEHIPCFSTFLIESRASHRTNAVLKDFVFGSFDTCKLEVEKICLSSEIEGSDYITLIHTYEYNVTNSGLGDIDSVSFRDDGGTPGWESPSSDDDPSIDPTGILRVGESITGTYTTTNTLNPPTNTIYATGHMGEFAMAEVKDSTTCEKVELDLNISVTKECKQTLEAEGDRVVVRVDYAGQVCNTENDTLLNGVMVTDDVSGQSFGPFTLYAPNDDVNIDKDCASYSGVYYPSTTAYACAHSSVHQNEVTAIGYGSLNGKPVTATAPATCDLCDSLGCKED